MKSIILIFSTLYLWSASLLCIDKPLPYKEEATSYTEFLQQYMFEIGEDINKEVSIEDYTDEAMMYAIERVCQQRHLTIEQTFVVYKLFFL